MTDTLGLSLALDGTALSQYAGVPFTGFFRLNGELYGTAPDGLYRIVEGGDDDGRPVVWELATPDTDVGSPQFKRARTVTVEGPQTENVTAAVVYDGERHPTMGTQQSGGRFAVGRDGAGRTLQCRLRGAGPAELTGVTVDVMRLGSRARR